MKKVFFLMATAMFAVAMVSCGAKEAEGTEEEVVVEEVAEEAVEEAVEAVEEVAAPAEEVAPVKDEAADRIAYNDSLINECEKALNEGRIVEGQKVLGKINRNELTEAQVKRVIDVEAAFAKKTAEDAKKAAEETKKAADAASELLKKF